MYVDNAKCSEPGCKIHGTLYKARDGKIRCAGCNNGVHFPQVKPMTESEKLIWIAVFSNEWMVRQPMDPSVNPTHKDRESSRLRDTQTAAAVAGSAVLSLRESQGSICDEFHEDSEIAIFAAQMVE